MNFSRVNTFGAAAAAGFFCCALAFLRSLAALIACSRCALRTSGF